MCREEGYAGRVKVPDSHKQEVVTHVTVPRIQEVVKQVPHVEEQQEERTNQPAEIRTPQP